MEARFYSWESEILKQIGNQEKLTLVGSALRAHIWILSIVCAWP